MDTPPNAAAPPSPSAQDVQHLRLLGVFYYIWGGLNALGGCFATLYIVMGIAVASGGIEMEPDDPPAGVIGGLFAGLGACLMIVFFAFAALYILTGYYLQNQRNRTFCMVMAAISCLSVPLGTILGVFTLVVLSRTSVIELFERNRTMT
jgi:hypothetical protein